MRLAVFVDVFPELSETFILNEVKALAAEGVDVRVEAGKHSDRPNPEAADAPPVVYWDEPGSRADNLKAFAWLAARRGRAAIAAARADCAPDRAEHRSHPRALRGRCRA